MYKMEKKIQNNFENDTCNGDEASGDINRKHG